MVGIGLKKQDGLPVEIFEKESANIVRITTVKVERIHIDKLEARVNDREARIDALKNFDYAVEMARLEVDNPKEIDILEAENTDDQALLTKVKAVK